MAEVHHTPYTAAVATNAGRDAWKTLAELFFDGEAQHRFHQASASIGVSPGLLKGLIHLDISTGVPMRDLADHFGCDASYVTTLVDGLEQHGFARREAHPTDRRVKAIVLTDAGAAARDTAMAVLYEPPPSFDVLDAAEQRTLRDLLAKVAAADAARQHARGDGLAGFAGTAAG